MKTLLVRLSTSISVIAFPGLTLLLPTYPLPVQVGYAVVMFIAAHGAVQEWRVPEAGRADRAVAALAISGVVLSGLLFILTTASLLNQLIHRPGAPTAPLA
jgi:hypothetical protein